MMLAMPSPIPYPLTRCITASIGPSTDTVAKAIPRPDIKVFVPLPARAAVPDRLYINAKGFMWFCEFKRKGKVPTPAQQREHDRLRMRGVVVYVIDTVEDGKEMVDRHA